MKNIAKLTIRDGTHIWKCHREFYNQYTFLHGYPYYQVKELDNVYYLWKLNKENPNSPTYKIIRQSKNWKKFREEVNELCDDLRSKKPYYDMFKK